MLLFLVIVLFLVVLPITIELAARREKSLLKSLREDLASYVERRAVSLRTYAATRQLFPIRGALADSAKLLLVGAAVGAAFSSATAEHSFGGASAFAPYVIITVPFAIAGIVAAAKGTVSESVGVAIGAAAFYGIHALFSRDDTGLPPVEKLAVVAGLLIAAVIEWLAGRKLEKPHDTDKAG